MFVTIQDLELRPRPFDVEIPAGEIDYLDPKLTQSGPLKASGVMELVSSALDEIQVKGHLAVKMDGECDRCLEAAEFLVDSDFDLTYRPLSESHGEEKKIGPEDAHIGFYEGDGLELNEALREYVLLALPMQRLCSEDCKGLCPVCGQSLSQTNCGCRTVIVDDRWAALNRDR